MPLANEVSRQKEGNKTVERPDKLKNIKEKRLMSKSAQKYRSNAQMQNS